MCSFVYFEVFASREHFAALGKRARERFLSRVNADVIHEFVLCFERFPTSLTLQPKARMVRALRSSDVLDREVRYDFMHGDEGFPAWLLSVV